MTAPSNDSTLPKARDQDQGYIASDFLDGVKKEFYLKDRTLSGQTKAQSRIQRDDARWISFAPGMGGISWVKVRQR